MARRSGRNAVFVMATQRREFTEADFEPLIEKRLGVMSMSRLLFPDVELLDSSIYTYGELLIMLRLSVRYHNYGVGNLACKALLLRPRSVSTTLAIRDVLLSDLPDLEIIKWFIPSCLKGFVLGRRSSDRIDRMFPYEMHFPNISQERREERQREQERLDALCAAVSASSSETTTSNMTSSNSSSSNDTSC